MMPPIIHTILKIHLKRLGLARVVIGALGMYVTIPAFLLIHVAVVTIIAQGILFPLLKINTIHTRNFIILDRYKVKGLSRIDTFNCLFCGWVNGICTFLNKTTDEISNNQQKLPLYAKAVILLTILSYTLPGLFIQTSMHLWSNYLIMAPLRLKKISYRSIIDEISKCYKTSTSYSQLGRYYLTYQKITWVALERALEQIESSWCPIKHFEQMESTIYPQHHRLFFKPDQITKLHKHLIEHGTVLTGKRDRA
jgi:hypothetical protein